MIGSYVLVIENDKDQNIQIGKLGKLFFKKGFYAYVGSALNGLEHRINRHRNSGKNVHWHIDYLLDKTNIAYVFIKESKVKEECKIAHIFKEKLKSVSNFGCSDCNCSSHLFYGSLKDIFFCNKMANLVHLDISNNEE